MKKIIFTLSCLFVAFCGYSQVDNLFWFAAPSVTSRHGDSPIELRLASFNDSPTDVIIDVPADVNFSPITFTILPMGSYLQDLSQFKDLLENKPNNTVLNKGIRIRASQAITAYYEVNRGGLNAEIFTLKGTNALGKTFFTPFQTKYSTNSAYYDEINDPRPDPANSSFTIVATEQGTTRVTIRLKEGKVAKGGSAAPQANIDFVINLTQGQSYTVFAQGPLGENRLDGTLITSDQAIAVTICDDSIEHPSIGAIDLTGDQIVPVNVVGDKNGSEYLVARGFAGNNNDENIAYILATEPDTKININVGTTYLKDTTIQAGETFEYILPSALVASKVISNKPVYLLYLSGFGGELGSPLLPSIKCTGSSKVSFVRSTENDFFIVILAQKEAVGNFTLKGHSNESVINDYVFQTVPSTTSSGEWRVLQVKMNDIEVEKAYTLINTKGYFHLGIINGQPSGGSARFGYFSDFGKISTSFPDTMSFCANDQVNLDPKIFGYKSATWYKNKVLVEQEIGPNGELKFVADPASAGGEYRVELVDTRSCEINDTVTLIVHPKSGVSLVAPPSPVCSNANYTINAQNSFRSYQWKYVSPFAADINLQNTTSSHKPDKSGTYRVVIVDKNSCKDSAEVLIRYVNAQLVKLLDPISAFCSGGSQTLTHQTPPDNFKTYAWKYNGSAAPGINNSKSYKPSFTASGAYLITLDVTDANNCQSSDSKTINYSESKGIDLGGNRDAVCTNSNYKITLSGDFTNVKWYLNGNLFTPTDPSGKSHKPVLGQNGTYTVTANDINGCKATSSIIIKKVVDSTTINLNSPLGDVCSNTNFMLKATPGDLNNYTWYLGSTILDTKTSTHRPNATGRYTVVAIDSNACQSSKSIDIKYVDVVPLELTQPDPVFCANDKQYVIDPGNAFDKYELKYNNTLIAFNIAPNKHRPVAGGTYEVEGTKGTCKSKAQVSINFKDTVNFQLPDAPAKVCDNSNGVNTNYIIEVSGNYQTAWLKDGIGFSPNLPPNRHKPDSKGTYKVVITDVNGCTASDQVFVNYFIPQVLTLNVQPEGQISCWNRKTKLTPTEGFEEYIWSTNNGITIPRNIDHYIPEASGVYTVVGIDANTCKSTDQATIKFVPDFKLDLGGVRKTCSNVSFTIDATKPNISSYVWSTNTDEPVPVGTETRTFEVNKPGFYSVRLTDINGCTDEDTLELKIVDELTIDLGPDRYECSYQNTPIDATPNYAKYIWTNTAGLPNPTEQTSKFFPKKTGTYMVTVKESSSLGCEASDTINITYVEDLGFQLKDMNSTICANIGGTISGKFDQFNTGYNWVWTVPVGETSPGNAVSFDPKKDGRYTVTITDPVSQCKDSDFKDIVYSKSVLDFDLGDQDRKVCFRTSNPITSRLTKFRDLSNFEWTWPEIPAGIQNPNGAAELNPTVSGRYVARIVDKVSQCPATDTVNIDLIADFETKLGEDAKVVCFDSSSITLNAGGGYENYNWQQGVKVGPTDSTYTPQKSDGAGWYYVVVRKSGCDKKDSVFLRFAPPINVNLNLRGQNSICFEQKDVKLTVAEGFDTYQWSDTSITTREFTPPRRNKTYVVTVTQFGCPKSDTASLTFLPDITIDPWSGDTLCEGGDVKLSGGPVKGYKFVWLDGGPGSTDTVYFAKETGKITLIKSDSADHCSKTKTTDIFLVKKPDFNVSDTIKCPESKIQLNARGPEFTRFEWQGSLSNPFEIDTADTFFVDGYAKGGCKFRDSVVVTHFSIDTLELGYDAGDNVFCSYDNFTLDATNKYMTYTWYSAGTPGSKSTYTPTASGPTQVVVVDSNGCMQTDLVVLNINQIRKPDLGDDIRLCSGSPYELSLPDNEYTTVTWHNGSTSNTYRPIPGDSLIKVNVSRDYLGTSCYDSASVIIQVAPPLNLRIDDMFKCIGDGKVLDPIMDYKNYVWYFTPQKELNGVTDTFLLITQGPERKTLEPLKSGYYQLTVTGQFNCEASTFPYVDYFDYIEPLSQDTAVCIGGKVTFYGGANYDYYTWLNKEGNVVAEEDSFTTDIPGTYTLIVKKEVCEVEDTSTIVFEGRALPVIDKFIHDTSIVVNKTLNLCYDVDKTERLLAEAEKSYRYSWSLKENLTDVISNINLVDVAIPGTYQLTVTDTNGCLLTDTIKVVYNDDCFKIPNLFTPNFDEKNDKFEVTGIRADTWDLSVFNRWGDKIYYEQGYNNTWDAANVTDGVYYYLLENPTTNKTYRGWVQILGRKN